MRAARIKQVRWLLTLVCLTLLVYVTRRVDWSVTAASMRRASPAPLIAAMLLNAMSVVLRGVRWWIFLRPAGACSLAIAVRGAIVGAGLNNVLVANGGDAARVLLVASASGVSRPTVLATLALDRMFDPICFGLLLFTATFLVPLPVGLTAMRGVVGASLLAAGALLVALTRVRGAGGPRMTLIGWRRRGHEFRERVQSLASVRRFALALVSSFGVWTLQVSKLALVAMSLHLGLPISASVAAMLLINTGLVLRATPGNLGYFQLAYAVAVSRYGVATDAAVATAMLIQAIEIVPVTLAAVAVAPGLLRSRRDTLCAAA